MTAASATRSPTPRAGPSGLAQGCSQQQHPHREPMRPGASTTSGADAPHLRFATLAADPHALVPQVFEDDVVGWHTGDDATDAAQRQDAPQCQAAPCESSRGS